MNIKLAKTQIQQPHLRLAQLRFISLLNFEQNRWKKYNDGTKTKKVEE